MLFRRITQHIKEQNWTAVAIDFVIVVLGVFVGLQVSNWNAARSDRALERVYVQRLADDLREDVRRIDWMIGIYETKQRVLLVLRDGPVEAAMAGDPKQAALDLTFTEWKGVPGPRRGSYDELIGSGNFSLLQNVELRNALADYYSQYTRTMVLMDDPIGDYKRRFAESIPGDIIVENLEKTGEEAIARIIAGLTAMAAQSGFEQSVNAEMYYGRDMLNWLRLHREQATGLLTLLAEEEAGS